MSIFKNLTLDDQDYVSILAVKDCAALGKLLEPQDCATELLPVIVKYSQDKSWRVRLMVADQLDKLCEAVGLDDKRSESGLLHDLFLLQCCAALAPANQYANRILERFELSDYLSLNLERSNEYEPTLVQEMLTLIIQIVQERRFYGLTPGKCLQRDLVYRLSTKDATHSKLLKSLPGDLSKFDELEDVLNKIAV